MFAWIRQLLAANPCEMILGSLKDEVQVDKSSAIDVTASIDATQGSPAGNAALWATAPLVEGDKARSPPGAGRLPHAVRAGGAVHGDGMGRELPAAHAAAFEAEDVREAIESRGRRIAALEGGWRGWG